MSNRVIVYYEHQATRDSLEYLEANRLACWKQWWALRRQPIEAIVANLRTVLDDSALVCNQPMTVRWTLPDVELEGVWIGDLEISLNLEEFEVQVFNQSVDTDDRGGYQHPHVGTDGRICWNHYDEEAYAYHRAGDFVALRDLIHNLLHTYNANSPYIGLEEWENGYGSTCDECGDRYPDDEMSYLDGRDILLCPECVRYCETCDVWVHYRDYSAEWEMCELCVADRVAPCAWCEERQLLEEMCEVEESEDEPAVLVCEQCFTTEKEKEKQSDEDHVDATRVLASPVAVPENAE